MIKKDTLEWNNCRSKKLTIKMEEINQKILVKERKLKRYRNRIQQYKQNWIFENDERKFYWQVNGENRKSNWM